MAVKSRGTRPPVINLEALTRRTAKLRTDLQALVQRFPEDKLDVGERVFVRLLSPSWRPTIGDLYGCYERKQAETIAWISRYADYLRDLETYFCNILVEPKTHRELPLHTYQPLSADECLRRLSQQHAALKSLRTRERNRTSKPGPQALVERLARAIDANGIKDCIHITGLHRDTINDVLRGRVPNPQRKTAEKLEKYLSNPDRPVEISKSDNNEHVTAEESPRDDASRSESGDDPPQILRK